MEGLIYLEDGTVFKGIGFGARGTVVGELVFNTSMTGYQKILTDPSYKGQIITMTYPLIGNYGVSDIDNESDGIHAFGLVIKDLCDMPSNSNSVMSLDQWLREQKVPGVFGVDTRQITKKIRKFGTVKCLISTEDISIAEAKELCSKGELRGDWMKEASTKESTCLEPTAVTEEKPYEVAVSGFRCRNQYSALPAGEKLQTYRVSVRNTCGGNFAGKPGWYLSDQRTLEILRKQKKLSRKYITW